MPKNEGRDKTIQDMSDEDIDLLVEFFESPEGSKYMKDLLRKDVPSKKHGGSIKIR